MASVNKVILVGNVGRDPEVRYLPTGQAVANFSIATSQRRKNKQTGETIEDTQWHRVTAYERLAEIVSEYVKKGRSVYVEGRLKYGEYTDKDTGAKRHTTDIVITDLQLLGGAREGGESGSDRQSSAPTRSASTAPAPAARTPAAAPAGGGSGFDDMDDDIPFRDPLSYRGAHLAL